MTQNQLSWLKSAFECVNGVDCSDGFRDGVPDDWSSH